jgi:PiT family inorganic phosphate transporter
MAFSHGSNDAQKTMGVISLALLLHGSIATFHVPLWVMLLSAVTMGLGTAWGGWRIIKTMGVQVTKLEYYQGFCGESAAGAVIEAASRFGIPLSTTHTIGTAIMGVGAARRLRAVRWSIAGHVVAAWVLTFRACIQISAAFCVVTRFVFR